MSREGRAAFDALLAGGLLEGDRRAVARAISLVERGEVAPDVVAHALAPRLGRAHVVGVTGAPGAGKSTLVHALLGELLKLGRRIAVVAVDPSSPISGGAVLGDRVRMGRHGEHADVFIRSLASRGHAGGLSRCTTEVVDLLDAAGFDTVIVETVGAGQAEVDIMRLADTRIVACPPGLGDAVQAIKAGILEIADLLVVTKSELPGAATTLRDLKDMLPLRSAAVAHPVSVLPVSAIGRDGGEVVEGGDGVAELAAAIAAHREAVGCGRRLALRRAPVAVTDPAAHVRALAAADPCAVALGIACTDAGAGHATVEMTLTPQHLNFMGGCHGGVIFTLADTAFGLAANSHGRVAAGIDAHITYQHAARVGDRLVAQATESSVSRRLGFYTVRVFVRDGPVISNFTGTVAVKR
ncbi:MAG: methylmalonyl Co-A mutase-associated GTPase MeaB [Burkholderiales bacterium]|nr:methylmalonyl Co-A mutase-associated GTPase MeaB [Burkholderiales bacterium]